MGTNPHARSLVLKERKLERAMRSNETFFLVDRSGFVYRQQGEASKKLKTEGVAERSNNSGRERRKM